MLVLLARGARFARPPVGVQRNLFVSTVVAADDKKKDEKKPQVRGKPYSELAVGVPKETLTGERRVAQTPTTVAQLVKSGFKVTVESGAGAASSFSDEEYKKAGATIGSSTEVHS